MTRTPSFTGLLKCLSAARAQTNITKTQVLASFSTLSPKVDQLALFSANHRHMLACLWHVQAQGVFRLGLGQAHEFKGHHDESWQALGQRWQHMVAQATVHGRHRPALFGGFAFDKGKPRTRLWRDFPDSALTLPRFEWHESQGQTRLVVNVLVGPRTDCRRLARALFGEWAAIGARSLPTANADQGAHVRRSMPHLWKQDVSNAVNLIQRGSLKKVVLARSQKVPASEPLHVVMQRLLDKQPHAYLFAFARDRSCFVGASPECLLSVRDQYLHTMALAGSAPRGQDAASDEHLGAQLLASEKDNAEHAMVVASLSECLQRHCTELQVAPRPHLHKLAHIQHLLTPMTGLLRADNNLLSVAECLHPTPAVGGLPRQAALDYIRHAEQLDRGWYAGPVGWLNDRGDGEFAVALRSALLEGGRATLFAGCGLVEGSDPESEYRESDLKMQTMREVLIAD
ncbi:salicylate biosynthesis isochorismate synthase [Pseudomonas agarici]|uniref:isochorismate synthase n=1 Tax=Pseudomonas agarici TaxID=46677 RepID=A0A0X1T671_PSEAA|nr:isochorismate synthase [Pseudomonas agarici]AMB87607.1 salicylate biosynthesis isochorismate synthase [Pseudomonas agarici]